MRLAFVSVIALALLCSGCLAGGDKPPPAGETPPAPRLTHTALPDAPASPATPPPAAAEPTPTSAPLPPLSYEGPPSVYFVPIEDFPLDRAERLARYFREMQAVNVGVLPAVPLEESMIDGARRQVIADEVLAALDVARLPQHQDRVLIALMEYDMYMLDMPSWNWVFSLRDPSRLLAVVSTAHMDPVNYREPEDEDLLVLRAAKMLGKQIGTLYYGLPFSDDPTNVMYNGLTSLDALDRVSDNFTLY
jgi:predicted Zn-dependent protease